jgi:hypothetical protein
MANTNNNLTRKVEDWLGHEGYRLEYITQKALADTGLTTVMSNYFESADGSLREIDVTASEHHFGTDKAVSVRLMCECKYSVDKPWILLQSGMPANLFCDWLSLPKSPALHEISENYIEKCERFLCNSWHFSRDQYFAHNLVQAFRKNNRDVAFDSLKKISNAAWDYVETPHRRGKSAYLVAIPSIIVDAPLFWASFSYNDNKFVAREVPYGRLSWGGCRNGTLVDIVHVSALNEYAQAIRNTFTTLIRVIVALQTFC